MKRLLFLFLIFPSCLLAQESDDYLKLIREELAAGPVADSATDMRLTSLRLFKRHFFTADVKTVQLHNGKVEFVPGKEPVLRLGGSYSAGYSFKRAASLPLLQRRYAQGRSVAGALSWRGAETGEMFSYGPALSALEYDGSTYPFDANGRLVPAGTGNGKAARPYDNSLLRTGSLFNQSFSLAGELNTVSRRILDFNFRIGNSSEQLILPQNHNTGHQLDARVNVFFKKLELRTGYLLNEDKLANPSRNGFLQRVYRNMLLTPASFDNAYGAGTPAYGSNADNPRFLLDRNGRNYSRRQQQGSLGLLLNLRRVKLKALQSYEQVDEHANESYMPGTAGFPAGAIVLRDQQDRNYFLQTEARYYVPHFASGLDMEASAGFVFTDNRSVTAYRLSAMQYDYQRSAGNLSLQYDIRYRNVGRFSGGLELGALSVFSNTARNTSWMMPSVSGHLTFDDNYHSALIFKASGNYRQTATELPVGNSLAYANLLRYAVSQANLYLPNTEADSFDGLDQTKARSWNAGLEVTYDHLLVLTVNRFGQATLHDVFPIAAGDRLELRNVGGHRREGWELELEKFSKNSGGKFSASGTISFTTWKHRVTAVENGYDYTPLAGFSDVYKVMAKDQPFGVIMGSAWLRDASGRMVIGADGFPLVAPEPKIIGNPVPDFIMKFTNELRYRKFRLQTNLEWRKGGDVWNGTAAVLDYYGRSAKSDLQRDVRGYVFPGVTQNGHPNNTPVQFYDPAKPFEQNRWVRYGYGGVAEDYIEKGDCLRLRNVELAYSWTLKEVFQKITVAASAGNIILWKAYSGSDPDRLLFDQPNTSGLDFFQLPPVQSYGLHFSFQF
ncbi:hypothetical protein ACFOTA_18990 [Chitinophaga sp. GCM10012297]|uniref:TonB-dependent receptor n=1 Tax=Chitinophaga chungangae TaxID=2821488 RepID=A0ABS3YHY7_9BACT|nr:hypothetical protein [Chitinophaga chungangae]MBO9154308.1 hypothetical protein [Chitinophaga chungangae]